MTYTLTKRQRTLLLFLSASGYTAWFSGLGDRLEAQAMPRDVGPPFTLGGPAPAPRVASIIIRDPFDVYPHTRREPDASAATTDVRTPPPLDAASGSQATTVVPNIATASGAGAGPPVMTLAVRATIAGPNPVAYVANGTAMDVVRVGDMLGDRRVTKIDLRGLTFGDGSHLDLPNDFVAPAARATQSGAITLRLEDLKRLLAPQAAARPASSDSPSVAPPAPPQPLSTYPTPGPLPTAGRDGLPVGVNPTSEPGAPTPYPYPYPYAPAVR